MIFVVVVRRRPRPPLLPCPSTVVKRRNQKFVITGGRSRGRQARDTIACRRMKCDGRKRRAANCVSRRTNVQRPQGISTTATAMRFFVVCSSLAIFDVFRRSFAQFSTYSFFSLSLSSCDMWTWYYFILFFSWKLSLSSWIINIAGRDIFVTIAKNNWPSCSVTWTFTLF